MLPEKLAFVDIETTGVSLRLDRIIEIGILQVENNTVKKTFQSLIDPQRFIPDEIEQLTGIGKEQLENAPTFRSVAEDILEMIPSDYIFVAHNVRFDYGFLRYAFESFGSSFSRKHFCTVKLSRLLTPAVRGHNLDSIIQRYNIVCKKRHRAFDDARVLWDFYSLSQKLFPEEKLSESIRILLRRPAVPLHIPENILDALPEACGVYIFYGQEGMPLYIGKSKNIKERVLSHFSSDHTVPIEMKISQQVYSIETTVTPGELGALFLESLLIKKMQPLYNRKLRLKRNMILLRKKRNSDGYMTVDFEQAEKITYAERESIVGVFSSKKRAKEFLLSITKKHLLCQKLLSLEKTKKACFGYRLETCKGACIGKEKSIHYNLRFALAIAEHKIKQWPFKGPIVIEEGEEAKQTFIFDNWCLLGGSLSNSYHDGSFIGSDSSFDFDTYKILLGFLRSPKNSVRARLIPKEKVTLYLQTDSA